VKRLILFAIVLHLSLLALITATMAYIRSRSADNAFQAAGLKLCNGKPCFEGIIPGFTPWSEAIATFAKRRDSDVSTTDISIAPNSHTNITLFPTDDGKTVGVVVVYFSGLPSANIGSLVVQYGIPCTITTFTDIKPADEVQIHYPFLFADTNFAVVGSNNSISPYSPISKLQFSTEILPCVVDHVRASDTLAITSWYGFASMHFYVAHWL
jgi:hypothetical protein